MFLWVIFGIIDFCGVVCFLCCSEFLVELISGSLVIFLVQSCWVFNHSFVELVLFLYQFEDFIFDPGLSVVLVLSWLCVVFVN